MKRKRKLPVKFKPTHPPKCPTCRLSRDVQYEPKAVQILRKTGILESFEGWFCLQCSFTWSVEA